MEYISIHALLAESDLRRNASCNCRSISIHALLAESDLAGPSGPAFLYNFYPRSPCGERLLEQSSSYNAYMISIHALLAESDDSLPALMLIACHFYPRSPCGERLRGWTLNINGPIFLSTLSLRRATVLVVPAGCWLPISIHALLAESD